QHFQLPVLLFGLNSLGNDFHAEVSRQCRNGADDGIVVVGRQPGYEGTIDLEVIKRETVQITERRIAGAKIVDAQLHAEGTQLLEHQSRSLSVLHHHAFGDLELEEMRT